MSTKEKTKPKNFLERHGMVTPQEAAKILDSSTVLIHRYCHIGKFAGAEQLPGGFWVIPLESVMDYKKNRRGPGRPRKDPAAA